MKPSIAIALWALVLPALSSAAAKDRPAMLFCSPQGPAYGWVDLNYLDELHQHGFDVDYTESLTDVTPQRIRRYNALVIFITPGRKGASCSSR
jgi:hypothetical protein